MGLVTSYTLCVGDVELEDVFDIDESYYELSEGLDALGLDGNYIVIGSEGDSSDPEDNGDGTYDAELAPAYVKKVWPTLAVISFEAFYAAFERTELGKSSGADLKPYLEGHFATLKQVYELAASKGAAIKVSAS